MAEKESIYGIKYEVDIDELKTSTSEATRQIKFANAEFKKSTSTLENWADSTDGISAKIKQLNSVLEAQKSKLANTKKTYNDNIDALDSYGAELEELRDKKEKAIKQYGKESTEVEKLSKEIAILERKQSTAKGKLESLRISILNQETAINKTKVELEKYGNKLEELTRNEAKTASATQKLTANIDRQESELKQLKKDYTNVILEQGKGSKEAKELSEKIKQLNASLQQNKTKLNEAENEAEQLTSTLKATKTVSDNASGGFSVMKGAVAGLIANAITAGISKVAEFTTQILEMGEATKEYRSMTAKLSGSANSFGYSLDWVKEKYKELYGYLADDQMTTNAITNLLGLGLKTKSLDSLVNSAVATWSAYGDSIPIESLTESIAETINVSKVTGTLADAINWASLSNEKWTTILGKGSKAQKAFNKAKKEGESVEDAFSAALSKTTDKQERARLVSELLNQTFGKSKQKYDELTGSITEANRAELELKDAQAELGTAVEPVNTAITNLKTKALDAVTPAIKRFIINLANMGNQLGASKMGIAGFALAIITTLVTGIINGIPKLITSAGQMMTAFGEGMKANLPSIISKGLDIIDGLASSLLENVPKLVSSGMDMLKNIVMGLMQSLPELIARVPEIIGKFADSINNSFPIILAKGAGIIWEIIKGLLGAIPDLIANIPQIFSAFLKVWTAFNWLSLGKKVISFLGDGIKSMGGFIKESAKTINKNVVDFIKTLPSKLATIGRNAIKDLGGAIRSMLSTAKSAIKVIADGVINGIKGLPKKALSIGTDLVKGLWNGISDMAGWVLDKVKGFGNSVLKGIKKTLGIKSPSRKTRYFGQMLDEGLAKGIEDGKRSVERKAENMAKGVLSKIRNNFKEKVQIGYEAVENLKGRTANVIRNISTGMDGNGLAYAGATSNVNNVTFNQYNTSPKAIDSLEVYRNTQKQIRMFQKWKGGK